MELYTIFIFLIVQAAQANERPELRMDDYVDYLKYQDIVKAISNSKPPWIYGYSIDPLYIRSTSKESVLALEGSCIYFRKENISEKTVEFTKHEPKELKKPSEQTEGEDTETSGEPKKLQASQESEKLENDKEVVTKLYGKFFNTTLKNADGKNDYRNTSNGITITEKPDQEDGKSYKLLYSDNKHCSILRPFTLPKGEYDQLSAVYLSYTATEAHCILLLSDEAARGDRPPKDLPQKLPSYLKDLPEMSPTGLPKGMPLFCKLMYRNLCGHSAKVEAVFKKSCPKIPNVLGC